MAIHEDFLPKIGLGPIKLGMNQADIEASLGSPIRYSKKYKNKLIAVYDKYSITYNSKLLVQSVEVYSGSIVKYKGRDIFTDPAVRRQLIEDDGNAQTISGVIVLLNLGISLFDLDGDNNTDKGISIFDEGVWDDLKTKMVPYSNTN